MNTLFWAIAIIGVINVAAVIIGIANFIVLRDFRDVSKIWNSMKKLDQQTYKLILDQYNSMESVYQDQKRVYELMILHYDEITGQYQDLIKLNETYRTLCKECIDRYSDSYEQFKLCNEKLDKLVPPQVSVSFEDFEANNEDIVI